MTANNRQVGGNHYATDNAYQHWDLVVDTGMNYLAGNATKYIARWRKKNGKQDLEKAEHYLDKLIERHDDLNFTCPSTVTKDKVLESVRRFGSSANLELWDFLAIMFIAEGRYTEALGAIEELKKQGYDA